MPHLALTFLGGFAATLDGQPLTAFGTDKARALLVYLAVEAARPHQRAALAQLFWPDAPTERAAHSLRQTLLRVRQALHEDDSSDEGGRQPFLLLTRQTVQLNPLADCRLDSAVFGELLGAVRQHAHAQGATCRVCMGWLSQAAELYRGDFLSGFALRDSPPFEEWQLLQQEALRRQAVELLAQLAAYHEGRGEHEPAQRYAGRLVALEPWHEQGQIHLLRALAHSGQIGAAAEQYAAYSAALAREFGFQPAATITELHRQIQARQVGGETGGAQLPGQAIRDGAPASSIERRPVTVLSCRWHDPASQGDPEALAEHMSRFAPRLQVLLDRYGGYRQPGQGDEWLIYFGYPQIYEDAARRALHVALALIEATRVTHALCIGIHTGVMVVRGDASTGGTLPEPIGNVPAVARGCQALAEPGAVLLTAATERLVRNWFACRSLGLKVRLGSAHYGDVYEVQGERTGRSHFDWLTQIEPLTPLAGRDQDLALLSKLLEATLGGHGATLTLSGEPGIGKSRLLWELRQRASSRVVWFERHCELFSQNTQLHPLIGLLEDILGIAERDSPEGRYARLMRTLAEYGLRQPGAAWLLAILLGLPTEPPAAQPITAQQRERQREVFVALLQRAATARPLVLVIEDLHWADPSTVAWLGASLEALAAAPCLTLLTFRPTFRPPWLPGPHLHALELTPLQPAAAEQMVTDLSHTLALPATLRQRIIAQSDGVPLFVEELTRTLRETGAQAADERIPSTLRESLLARLERVGAARETAGWAATLGREFEYAILASVVSYDEPRLQADLAALIEAGLLTAQCRHGRDEGYAFRHALVQEAAYSALLRDTRQTYHLRIAERYAERLPQIAEARPELLAHHYQQGGLSSQAAERWLLAGQRAFAQGAGQEAYTFFANALQLIEPDDLERRWHALIGQERALDLSRDREAQKAAIAALRALAETLDDDARRAYAALREVSYAGISGAYQDVLALVDMACAAAQRAARLDLELEALAYKAQTLAAFQKLDAAREIIEAALPAVERLSDHVLRARILTASAYCSLEAGDLSHAVLLQRQGLEAARRGGNHQLMQNLNANLGLLYATLGLYSEARATLEHGLEQALLVGDPWMQAGTMRHLGFVQWSCGEPGIARAHFEQALMLLTALGDAFGTATCQGYLGYLLAALGDYAAAAERLAQARAGFAAIGLEEDRIEAQAAEARVVLALGQRDRARQLATEVWSHLCRYGTKGLTEPALVCIYLADVFVALGEPDLSHEAVIALGCRDLAQRARKISDLEWQRSFLENVPTNRALIERWRHLGIAE